MPDLFDSDSSLNPKPRDMVLLRRINELENDTFFAPFLAIAQSSGYGKTRTVLEVAKKRRVIKRTVSCLRQSKTKIVKLDRLIHQSPTYNTLNITE